MEEYIAYSNVIIVEDDIHMRMMLKHLVEMNGFKSQIFSSAEDFINSDIQETRSIHIFDNNLPGISGLQLINLIRQKDLISPILIISGENDEDSVVDALKRGADDFILKPFSIEIMSAKMMNLQARSRTIMSRSIDEGIKFFPATHSILFNKHTLSLTKREYQIFESLYKNHDKKVTRESLVQDLGQETTLRNVDVIMCTLRKKIESLPIKIGSVRGSGYKLRIN